MITVTIYINGTPIFTRSAVNMGKKDEKFSKYKVDTGAWILHDPEEGAVVLATKMLQTIKEPGLKIKTNIPTEVEIKTCKKTEKDNKLKNLNFIDDIKL